MASVPRIDSPCPLSRAEQMRIDGHCSRCDKVVHVLNGLDDTQRRALFAAAKGPLCVSYRVPLNRSAAYGAAMAAMLSASTAMAGNDCDETKSEFQSVELSPSTQVLFNEAESERLDSIIFVGGVESAMDAKWVDDGSLPDLPFVVETESGQLVDDGAGISAVSKPR